MNEIIQYWPQLVVIALSLVGLGIDAYKIGKPSVQKASTPTTLIVGMMSICLLYYGGFKFLSFANLLLLSLVCIGVELKFKDAGKPDNTSFFSKLVGLFLVHLLYYWGGFYDCFL